MRNPALRKNRYDREIPRVTEFLACLQVVHIDPGLEDKRV